MKKILLLLTLPILIGASCSSPVQDEKVNQVEEIKISEEEKEFNDSGQAKAIEDESDLWPIYDNPELGISFNYPSDIVFLAEDEYNTNPKQTYIKVELKDIGKKEVPMDLDEEGAMKNIEALTSGEFGIDYDFPLTASKQVKDVGFLFAQDFMVLGRFEVCNVTLERKLLFYFNNKQIIITLYGPVDILKETMPDYFIIDNNNCGEEKIWDFEKQNDFYETLVNGNAPMEIQKWFNNFDQIAEEVIFAHR